MRRAPAFLALALLLAPSFAPAEESPRGEPLLPGEEELRALGDYAAELARRFAERIDPLAERLRGLMDDIDAYEAPEILPNGDIIIRRRPDAPPPEAPSAPEDGIAL